MYSDSREFEIQKGICGGGSSVMGRLCRAERLEDGSHFESEWARYSYAAANVRKEIESLCKLVVKEDNSDFLRRLLNILEVIDLKEMMAGARAMCDGGMRAEQVAAAFCGLNDGRFFLASTLILNRLYGCVEPDTINDTSIYVVENGDFLSLYSVFGFGALGAVFIGEADEMTLDLSRILSFPTIFLEDGEIFSEYDESKNVILSPEHYSLYLSPSLSMLDEFYAGLKLNIDKETSCSEVNDHIIQSFSNENIGSYVDVTGLTMDEEEIFKLYRGYAEAEGDVLLVRLPTLDSDNRKEHLRAACRAGVYGALALVHECGTAYGVRELREEIKKCAKELESEKRECRGEMPIFVVINEIRSMFLLREICEIADGIFLDVEELVKDNAQESTILLMRIVPTLEALADKPDTRFYLLCDKEDKRHIVEAVKPERENNFFVISLKKK